MGGVVRSQSTSVPLTHQKIIKSCKLADFRFQNAAPFAKFSFSFSFLEFHFHFCQGTFRIFILILPRNFIFNCYDIFILKCHFERGITFGKTLPKMVLYCHREEERKTSPIQESTECTWTTKVKVCYNIATQGRERNFYHGPHSS